MAERQKEPFNHRNIQKLYPAKGFDENIIIGVDLNHISVKHYPEGDWKRKAATFPLGMNGREAIRNFILEAIKEGPGYSDTITRKKWDDANKRFIPESTLTIGMDESGMMYMTLVHPNAPKPFTAYFKCPKGVEYGSKINTDATKSVLAAKAFISFLFNECASAYALSFNAEAQSNRAAYFKERASGQNQDNSNTGGGTIDY